MHKRILSLGLIAIFLGFQLTALAARRRDDKAVTFTVRIEGMDQN